MGGFTHKRWHDTIHHLVPSFVCQAIFTLDRQGKPRSCPVMSDNTIRVSNVLKI